MKRKPGEAGGRERKTRVRPEASSRTADKYYDESMTSAYTSEENAKKQGDMAKSALAFLWGLCGFNERVQDKLMLDVGCGSGLSTKVAIEAGLCTVATDLSGSMLTAAQTLCGRGQFVEYDMGHGLPFRADAFDGIVSISAVQWLTKHSPSENALPPSDRLRLFFSAVHRVLREGGGAVFQIYPEDQGDADMMVGAATGAGLSSCLIVDLPHHTPARKYFLVAIKGRSESIDALKGKICPLSFPFRCACSCALMNMCGWSARSKHPADTALEFSRGHYEKIWRDHEKVLSKCQRLGARLKATPTGAPHRGMMQEEANKLKMSLEGTSDHCGTFSWAGHGLDL